MSLRQIANNLELSITTVSRALGGHSDVSDATRQRIEHEAVRIGYVPNEMARRLQKGRADAIGIVFPGGPETFDDSYLLKILEGAWERLEEREMDLLVYPTPAGPREETMYRRLVEGRRVDGLILTRIREDDPRVNYLLAANFPFVTIGAGGFPDSRILTVDIDNVGATRRILQHLKDFGHRVIACGGPVDLRFAAMRHQVFTTVARELGLTPVQIIEPGTVQGGERVVARLIENHPEATALVCNVDRVTYGAMAELGRRGHVAGRDLSIISIGDTQLARMSRQAVSAVRVPIREMAVKAVDLLLRRRDGLPVDAVPDFAAEFILRDTTGPAPRQNA